MENAICCQSCGAPMDSEEMYGSNADGSKNAEYCSYCFQGGKFTSDMTMDEMIEFCTPHVVKSAPNMTEDAARQMLKEMYPSLKRWKK